MKAKDVQSKFGRICMPCLLLAAIFGLCGPLQLYLMNMSELWFSIGDIGWLCLLCAVVLFAILSVVGLLLPKRFVDYYAAILFGLSVGLYVQGNFVTTDYGVLDGRQIDWGAYGLTSVWNTALWLACIAIPVALQKVKPKNTNQMLRFASAIILAMQMVTVGLLFITNNFGMKESTGYVSDREINTVSSQENVIVLLLDAFDQEYFNTIRSLDSDYLSPLDGFTYFENFTGMYPSTKGAVPYILTGQVYENEIPYDEYIEKAFKETDYYQDLLNSGYDIGVYTEDVFMPSDADQLFENYIIGEVSVSSYPGFAKTLYNFVCFRYFPHILKEKFWFYSGAFDEWKGKNSASGIAAFNADNFDFYYKIKNDGLQVAEDTKCYRFIHLHGAHLPYNINGNMERITDGSATAMDAAKGSLGIVYEYIAQLKKQGLYNNSTIVVMADHGAGGYPTNPLFMVKPKNSTGSLQVNSAPVCQADFLATIAKDIGLNGYDKYGRSVFEVQEGEQRERKYLYYKWDDSWSSDYLPLMVEYWIDSENNHLASYHLKDRTIATYNLGDPLRFVRGGSGNLYCFEGFYDSDDKLTWAISEEATMIFEIGEFTSDTLKVQINVSQVFNNLQKIIISVGDYIAYDDTLTKPGRIEFGIRKEDIKDDILQLDFQFPNATVSQIGMGIAENDTRKLAIAFTDMVIEESNLTELELTALAHDALMYELGTTLTLNESENHTGAFVSGIAQPQKDYVWSLGIQGQIRLAIGEAEGPLRAEIGLAGTIDSRQTIRISAQGETLYDAAVPTGKSKIVFDIPKEAVVDGILTLDIEYPNAVAPQSINPDSTDTRILSVRYSDMVITAQSE